MLFRRLGPHRERMDSTPTPRGRPPGKRCANAPILPASEASCYAEARAPLVRPPLAAFCREARRNKTSAAPTAGPSALPFHRPEHRTRDALMFKPVGREVAMGRVMVEQCSSLVRRTTDITELPSCPVGYDSVGIPTTRSVILMSRLGASVLNHQFAIVDSRRCAKDGGSAATESPMAVQQLAPVLRDDDRAELTSMTMRRRRRMR